MRLSFDSKLQTWHVKRSLLIVLCCRVEGVQRYATCHKGRCVCEGCSSRHPWAEALMVCVVASSRWNVNLLQFLLSAALCSIAASLHTPCLAWAHFPCMPCLPVLISTPPFFFIIFFIFSMILPFGNSPRRAVWESLSPLMHNPAKLLLVPGGNTADTFFKLLICVWKASPHVWCSLVALSCLVADGK